MNMYKWTWLVVPENIKVNDVNRFISISMNMKGMYGNGFDWLFPKNRKANGDNGFIGIEMYYKIWLVIQ